MSRDMPAKRRGPTPSEGTNGNAQLNKTAQRRAKLGHALLSWAGLGWARLGLAELAGANVDLAKLRSSRLGRLGKTRLGHRMLPDIHQVGRQSLGYDLVG